MRRLSIAMLIAATVGLGSAEPARSADVGLPVPAGYAVASTTELGPGLTHTVLTATGPVPQSVHVARMRHDAPFRLRAVLSNEAVAEAGPRLERTSSMCQRVSCAVAVNADFAVRSVDEPVGAAVIDGSVARTPVDTHHQFSVAGRTLAAGRLEMAVQLVTTDLKRIDIAAVNRPRAADQVVLYTPANGATTGTNPHGVELVLTGVPATLGVNRTASVRIDRLRDAGDSSIPSGGAVLSGHGAGAGALRDLARRVEAGTAGPEALLRIDSASAVHNSVGGTPVLVRDGASFVGAGTDQFVAGRHPRTVAGWTAQGDVLLVTADGRQPGHAAGLSLPEAAALLVGLGATEALNLDGGGSTTFAVGATVANRPSDVVVRARGRDRVVHAAPPAATVVAHVERPVVTALAIVPVDGSPAEGSGDTAGPLPALPLADVVHLAAADPGSNPDGAIPAAALVVAADQGRPAVAAIAVALLVAVAAAAGAVLGRPDAYAWRDAGGTASSM